MAVHLCDLAIETTEEEYDSLESVSVCVKNPGHEQFYSVTDLTVDILPEGCRTEQWLKYILYYSKRVVRLTLCRPDGTRQFGTGCLHMNDDSGIMYIQTIKQVVGSQEDVKQCQIDFFFDTEDRTGIETYYGARMIYCDKELDVCNFTFNNISPTIKQLMSDSEIIVEPHTNRDNVISISHPHGGPKAITTGKYIKEGLDHGSDICTHTAKTCPGSSGGLVLNSRGNSLPYKLYHSNKFIQCSGESRTVYNGTSIETVNINYSVFTVL